ncbi:DNA repair protein Rad50 [Poseidonibacter lekithochrous]|uniref:DNA repair protein Rad50 n=1 Tax=Poseidonibacter lekithochrous TaxID=1904463 RepID=UPI000D3A3D4B|nr:DNA repair protein Rad50 [Poseidonibacter lekithochrous]
MKNIKEELKSVILDVMLPETETYLEELNKAIDNKSASEDEIDAREDIVSFIEELKTILEVISEDKLSDEDAKNVYEKITTMLEEHE